MSDSHEEDNDVLLQQFHQHYVAFASDLPANDAAFLLSAHTPASGQVSPHSVLGCEWYRSVYCVDGAAR
jgi:hypothetical protein